MLRVRFVLILQLLAALLFAENATAVDGVHEINQTCAINGGCFSVDAAGFPVEIASPGSYRLTSNLDISALASPQNISVVRVQADDVSLDLNGFAIIGAASCTGTPAVCTGIGTGIGVEVTDATKVSNTFVHNGTIRGMGDNAIRLTSPADGQGFRVEGIRAVSNGARGIRIISGQPSSIVDCLLQRNRTFGISAVGGGGGVISNNVAHANGSSGINANGPFTIIGNTVTSNQFSGITGTNMGLSSNVLDANGTDLSGGVQLGPNLCSGVLCP